MKIVIVEDDEVLLDGICAALEEDGHEPIPFPKVDAATAPLIAQAHPDVVVADIHMLTDGFNLADAFRDRPHPPIVFMAGTEGPPTIQGHGAVGFLQKPFSTDELLEVIKSAARSKWKRPLHLQR